MAEKEPIYRTRCPHYKDGPGYCCGRRHDNQRERHEQYYVDVEYTDGKPSERLLAFTLTRPTLERSGWETIRLESAAIQKLTSIWFTLSDTTQETLKNTHPGIFDTPLSDNCPFKE